MEKANTLKAVLARGCRYGNIKPALVAEETSYSFSTLQHRVNRLANGMLDLGLQKGDRVAILSKNSPEVVESYFGIPIAGLVVVVLNYRFSLPELKTVLIDSAPQVLLVSEEYLEVAEKLAEKLPFIKWTVLIGEHQNVPGGWLHYSTILQNGSDRDPVADIANDDLAALMYTSGTTGTPKGCMVTHGNLYHAGHSMSLEMNMKEGDVGLIPVPLFHASGLCMLMNCIYSGFSTVVMPCWNIEQFSELVATHRVTITMLATPMLNDLVAVSPIEHRKLASLQKVLFAGAPVSSAVFARAIERFGNIFIHGFGTTETVGSISILRLCDLEAVLEKNEPELLNSCGRGYMDMDVEVVDDSGIPCATPHTTGEVRVRGKGVTRGYWRKERETRNAFRDGWFYTGDLARVDKNGFISIVGRMRDMIISGAENVFPAEVENALQKHPAVYQAAVIGVQDAKWGEMVTAFVQLKAGDQVDAEAIRAFCKQEIASYKVPKIIHFVDELPVSATGKVLKGKLKHPEFTGCNLTL